MPPADPLELTEEQLEYVYIAYLTIKSLPANSGNRRTRDALAGILVKYGWQV